MKPSTCSLDLPFTVLQANDNKLLNELIHVVARCKNNSAEYAALEFNVRTAARDIIRDLEDVYWLIGNDLYHDPQPIIKFAKHRSSALHQIFNWEDDDFTRCANTATAKRLFNWLREFNQQVYLAEQKAKQKPTWWQWLKHRCFKPNQS